MVFIVASYDPSIQDQGTGGEFEQNTDYWNGNVDPIASQNMGSTQYIHKSNYGTKCKVEIISKRPPVLKIL